MKTIFTSLMLNDLPHSSITWYFSWNLYYIINKNVTIINDLILISGICLSTDVDTLLYHMNNARYLRELDFARVDFYERTQLYRTIRSKKGAVVQGACTIRYRRFVRPFSCYKITSKVSLIIKIYIFVTTILF